MMWLHVSMRRLVHNDCLKGAGYPHPLAQQPASAKAALAERSARGALMRNVARIYKLAPSCAINTISWAQVQDNLGTACEVSVLL